MNHKLLLLSAAVPLAAAALAFPSAPAAAQALSSGDFAQCTVYDREGRNRGLDTVCLERKRAQIARFQNQQNRFNGGAAPYAHTSGSCPLWANGGRGFGYTVNSDGSPPPIAAAFDAVMNGRPCMPSPNIMLRGIR